MADSSPPPALWSVSLARFLQLLRVIVLGLGLSLGLALAGVADERFLGAPFLIGSCFFLVATSLTTTQGYAEFRPFVMTAVPLLDMSTICLFDLIPRADAVGALVALPAMWLGLALGRRGAAVAGVASALLFVVPGLLLEGAPEEGWTHAISVVMFACIASAGMAVSTELWSKQIWLLEEREASLREATRIKDEVMSSVAHELRSPLTSILGYLDLVGEDEQPMSPRTQGYLDAVGRNSARLLLLVTDLLSASASQRAPMQLARERTDLARLARLSIEDATMRATDAGVRITLDAGTETEVDADPSRLLQVLDNLLSNAIKFTPAGGRVDVTVQGGVTGVDLAVRDTGVGIDAASLEHVGTKFFRARSATDAAIPGLGLGVMITKKIVEAHGGVLTFESREGGGTTVTIHVPYAGPQPTPARSDSTSSSRPTSAHAPG